MGFRLSWESALGFLSPQRFPCTAVLNLVWTENSQVSRVESGFGYSTLQQQRSCCNQFYFFSSFRIWPSLSVVSAWNVSCSVYSSTSSVEFRESHETIGSRFHVFSLFSFLKAIPSGTCRDVMFVFTVVYREGQKRSTKGIFALFFDTLLSFSINLSLFLCAFVCVVCVWGSRVSLPKRLEIERDSLLNFCASPSIFSLFTFLVDREERTNDRERGAAPGGGKTQHWVPPLV